MFWIKSTSICVAVLALVSCADISPPDTGTVQGTIVDKFDQPIENVSVTLTSSLGSTGGLTSSGNYGFQGVPAETIALQVDASGYEGKLVSINVNKSQTTLMDIQLERVALPVASALDTTSQPATTTTPDGTNLSLSFQVQVVAFDENGQPLDTLQPSDFWIDDFVDPDSGLNFVFSQTNVEQVVTDSAGPYSAMLLLDQSGSIITNDPTDARLFASKEFLSALGEQDYAAVSAFADGGDKLIESEPVSLLNPFTGNGTDVYPVVDSLASLEGGGSPFYDAVESMIRYTSTNAPNMNKAIIVFTDGEDTGSSFTVDDVISRAINEGVKLFVVGLSSTTEQAVLSKMANDTGGSFFLASDAQFLPNYYGTLGQVLTGQTKAYDTTWTVDITGNGSFNGEFTSSVIVNTPQEQLVVPFTVTQ